MASKLLNIRMDEDMLKDLKEVCGELGINVTDAIKTFSKEMIENRKLPTMKEEKREVGIESLINKMVERNEINGNVKEYEEMNEKISDIVLKCSADLRSFIDKNLFNISYQELIEEFKKEYGDKFKNDILDIIISFYESYYKEMLESYLPIHEEIEKFEQEKYISAMKNIKEKNPELYKELLDGYTYNLDFQIMYSFGSNGYFEVKKVLEELLSFEEIREYVIYTNKIKSCKTEQEKKDFIDNIPEERKKVLASILTRINEYNEKQEEMKKNNKEGDKDEENFI